MKMTKILSLILVLVMAVSCIVACGGDNTGDGGSSSKMKITMWVSTTDGVKGQTLEQVEAFKAETGYDFDIEIETVGEGDAGSLVLADLQTAPDMYWFAQDQLPRLVLGNALAKPGVKATETIKANNDAESIIAATVSDTVYAYPLTSDNGYFLYYNKSIVKDPTSLEAIVAACKGAGKKIGYAVENAWIMASFFFAQKQGTKAPICNSTWTYSEDGKNPVAHADTFNSANGLIAMKAMSAMTTSGAWVNADNDFSGTAALVSGIWNYDAAVQAYGDNLGIAKLPTFTVDGQTYQLGSYKGCKLIGVKPQADEQKAKICSELALWLTNEANQLERHYMFGWGPSNKEAQKDESVMTHPALKALAAQNEFAQSQGVIPGDWWTPAALLGTASYKHDGGDVNEAWFLEALAEYQKTIDGLLVK